MYRSKKTLWLLAVLPLLVLSACGVAAPAPTQDPAQLYTQIAATVVANMTQTAAAASPTPVETATSLASPTAAPTNTPLISPTPGAGTTEAPVFSFSTPTITPLISATLAPGQATATTGAVPTLRPVAQTSCDNFTFTDVNYPDGTVVPGGTNFVKTWEFTNTGPCVWNANYHLIYGWETDGAGWENTQPVAFNQTVAVGATIDLSVALHVPTKTSGYAAWFRLQNDKGYNFGPVFAVSVIVK